MCRQYPSPAAEWNPAAGFGLQLSGFGESRQSFPLLIVTHVTEA
jgi:hypothetical protein